MESVSIQVQVVACAPPPPPAKNISSDLFSPSGDRKALTTNSVWRIALSAPLVCRFLSLLLYSRPFPPAALSRLPCISSSCGESLCLLLSVSPSLSKHRTACTSGRWGNTGLLHSWALNRAEQPMSWLPRDESVHVLSWIRATTVTKLLCVTSHYTSMLIDSFTGVNHMIPKFSIFNVGSYIIYKIKVSQALTVAYFTCLRLSIEWILFIRQQNPMNGL